MHEAIQLLPDTAVHISILLPTVLAFSYQSWLIIKENARGNCQSSKCVYGYINPSEKHQASHIIHNGSDNPENGQFLHVTCHLDYDAQVLTRLLSLSSPTKKQLNEIDRLQYGLFLLAATDAVNPYKRSIKNAAQSLIFQRSTSLLPVPQYHDQVNQIINFVSQSSLTSDQLRQHLQAFEDNYGYFEPLLFIAKSSDPNTFDEFFDTYQSPSYTSPQPV